MQGRKGADPSCKNQNPTGTELWELPIMKARGSGARKLGDTTFVEEEYLTVLDLCSWDFNEVGEPNQGAAFPDRTSGSASGGTGEDQPRLPG